MTGLASQVRIHLDTADTALPVGQGLGQGAVTTPDVEDSLAGSHLREDLVSGVIDVHRSPPLRSAVSRRPSSRPTETYRQSVPSSSPDPSSGICAALHNAVLNTKCWFRIPHASLVRHCSVVSVRG